MHSYLTSTKQRIVSSNYSTYLHLQYRDEWQLMHCKSATGSLCNKCLIISQNTLHPDDDAADGPGDWDRWARVLLIQNERLIQKELDILDIFLYPPSDCDFNCYFATAAGSVRSLCRHHLKKKLLGVYEPAKTDRYIEQ